jgi:hypothetical protein
VASSPGEDLIQSSADLRPDETIEQATQRIEAVIDAWLPGLASARDLAT